MNRKWKDIPGTNGRYKVCNDGYVIGPYGKILKAGNNKGYLFVTLSTPNGTQHKLLHRLVAEAFVPNPTKLPQVHHKDEDKSNCKAYNLEWCTNIDNSTYSQGKKVLQLLHGNIIAEYRSISEAARVTKIVRSSISEVCAGTRLTAGGYSWRYKT